MKIIRSSKCSIKFATQSKKNQLYFIINEYKKTVNFFVDLFYETTIEKSGLLKDVINSANSWFFHRMKKTAVRKAIDMLKSSSVLGETKKDELIDKQKNKYLSNAQNMKLKKPKYHGKRMCVSSTIAELQLSQTDEFDAWLHIHAITNDWDNKIYLPIKFHKHYNKLPQKEKRLNYYIITKDSIQFSFVSRLKQVRKETVGLNTGIKSIAILSTEDSCGHTDKADLNAAINIRDRFFFGTYGFNPQHLDQIELKVKIL